MQAVVFSAFLLDMLDMLLGYYCFISRVVGVKTAKVSLVIGVIFILNAGPLHNQFIHSRTKEMNSLTVLSLIVLEGIFYMAVFFA